MQSRCESFLLRACAEGVREAPEIDSGPTEEAEAETPTDSAANAIQQIYIALPPWEETGPSSFLALPSRSEYRTRSPSYNLQTRLGHKYRGNCGSTAPFGNGFYVATMPGDNITGRAGEQAGGSWRGEGRAENPAVSNAPNK